MRSMTDSWTWFDVHGVRVRVTTGCPPERQLRDMLAPFRVEKGTDADITVTAEPPVLEAPSHGEHAYRYTDDAVQVCRDRVTVTVADDRYGVHGHGELLSGLLPVLDRAGVRKGVAMVHAATVAIGDAGICLPAWGGVGKTSTVARLMADPDVRFMGDDWAFVDTSGRLLGYSKPMFLKPHHRTLYPDAFAASRKPLAPSRFTDTVARAATAVHPVIIRYPRIAATTRRWSPEHLMVTPERAFPDRAPARSVPLRLACFVERYDGTTAVAEPVPTTSMVTRMLGNFHAELPKTSRDLIVALGACGLVGLHEYFAEKAEVLARALEGVPTCRLRVPASWPAEQASEMIAGHVRDLVASGQRVSHG